jgi:hypothetical protein
MLQAQKLGMTNGDFVFISYNSRPPLPGSVLFTFGLNAADRASYYQAATVLKVVGADLTLAYSSPLFSNI